MLLSKLVGEPTTAVESSRGNFGISYDAIFNRVMNVFKPENPVNVRHSRAARLVHIVHDIKVADSMFTTMPLGEIHLLVVNDKIDNTKAELIYDIAQLGDEDIVFVFKDNIINRYMSQKEIFSSMYSLFDILVAISIKPGLCFAYYSTISAIARYAPYVLAVKTMLALGYNVSIDDIDYSDVPEDNTCFINQITLEIVKSASLQDLLSYGALCDFANKK